VKREVWPRTIAVAIFISVFVLHALYLRHLAAQPPEGWSDAGVALGWFGFEPYFRSKDYFVGFSYAFASAFAAWAIGRCVISRRSQSGSAAAGSVTLVGALLAGGCFLIGCCGSPMLAIYLSVFGAKALGLAKPLMALITIVSVSCAYWCLSRRRARGQCIDDCACAPAKKN
jgi:hypothetical protein